MSELSREETAELQRLLCKAMDGGPSNHGKMSARIHTIGGVLYVPSAQMHTEHIIALGGPYGPLDHLARAFIILEALEDPEDGAMYSLYSPEKWAELQRED